MCVAEARVGRAPPCPLPTYSARDEQLSTQISSALPSPSKYLPVAFCNPNSRAIPTSIDHFDESYNYACAAPVLPSSSSSKKVTVAQSVTDLYDCITVANEYLPKSVNQPLTNYDTDKEVGICCMNRGSVATKYGIFNL